MIYIIQPPRRGKIHIAKPKERALGERCRAGVDIPIYYKALKERNINFLLF
jgi:hypothetical protein